MSKQITISPEEQKKLLESSISIIKTEIHQMRKCFETKSKFMDSLKHASTFLNELRTNNLTPKQYYELYIMVYDGLEYLSLYLKNNHPNNHLVDLYELVQYAGNIIPRLYLMITIGTVYMSIENSPIEEIMNDMLEMCKGVQHPIRGLFLRYYLQQRTKDLLPNNNETVNFLISNFIEMNKLWVRWQHQGHSSERFKRIKERKELEILVGSNLVRLSQLDLLIDKDYYKEKILPALLEQIIKCKDLIAQEYLMDVIIQIFPDEFQLISLKIFLDSILNLNENFNVNKILISLINRLIDFKNREPDNLIFVQASKDFKFFDNFLDFLLKLNELKPNLNKKIFYSILENFARFSIIYYPSDSENLNKIFSFAIEKFNETNLDGEVETEDDSDEDNSDNDNDNDNNNNKNIQLLILSPINENIKLLFNLNEDYFNFFNLQDRKIKNEICMLIIENFLNKKIKIETEDELSKIFKILSSIIVNSDNETDLTKNELFGNSEIINDEVLFQYENLSKFLHLIYNSNSIEYFKLLKICDLNFLSKSKDKIQFVYPTLISILIKLIRKMNFEKVEKSEILKIFKYASTLINKIKNLNPIKCLNLNLIIAEIANECLLTNIIYEFFIESFIIYEELVVESKSQFQCLMNIINKLISMDKLISLNIEDFDKLITKATLYGSRLLKKTDQCRAIYSASHLWWIIKEINEDESVVDDNDNDNEADVENESTDKPQHISLKKDEKRVLECLQKSLRTADSILDNNVSLELFIEILNQSLYYFIHGNEMISIKYLNGLIELIGNNFKELGKIEGPLDITWKHYDRTLKYIKEQRTIDIRFHELVIA